MTLVTIPDNLSVRCKAGKTMFEPTQKNGVIETVQAFALEEIRSMRDGRVLMHHTPTVTFRVNEVVKVLWEDEGLQPATIIQFQWHGIAEKIHLFALVSPLDEPLSQQYFVSMQSLQKGLVQLNINS